MICDCNELGFVVNSSMETLTLDKDMPLLIPVPFLVLSNPFVVIISL